MIFLLLTTIVAAEFIINSNNLSTWGSRFITGKKYHFALSEHFDHPCGISCWSTTSTCGVWKHKKDIPISKWEFVGHITINDNIPFCHDFALTLESNSTHNVLMGYVTPKIHKITKIMSMADFGPLSNKKCKNDIIPFDNKNYLRYIWLIYKVLNINTPIDVQIDNIFLNPKNQFTWLDITNKLPPRYRGIPFVNPQPLIDSRTGYGTLINNKRYSLHRTIGTRKGKTDEILVILSADKFIFEENSFYQEVKRINNIGLREDGWFETNGKTFTIIYHDLQLCRIRHNCGAIIYSDDLINWTNPKILYQSIMTDFGQLYYRQRPSIFRTKNETYLCTASATKSAGYINNKCNGGSRTYCIETKL